MKPWWERFPGRLEFELDELREQGIEVRQDEKAFAAGSVILELWFPTDEGEVVHLTAHYPDTYPYTRFEVKAPDLALGRHMGVFEKNLCLLGQATDNWNTNSTLFRVLEKELSTVLMTGRSDDIEAVRHLEENQADPESVYYTPQKDTIILIDGAWAIDSRKEQGEFTVGIAKNSTSLIRGAVLEIRDETGESLIPSNQVFESYYPERLQGRWVRVDSLPRKHNALEFLEELSIQHPALKKARWNNNVKGGAVDLIGVLFPEELDYRKKSDSWLFIVRAQSPSFGIGKEIGYFARTGRAGQTDLSARVPEVASITSRKVAVVGLGGVGWPAALELARNGVGELRVLDHDVVEPGTTVRWGFGFTAVGRHKTAVIREFINSNYPYTNVIDFDHRLGSGLNPAGLDSTILSELFDGVELMYDASAEVGIQHLLSDLATEFGIPYICASTRQGAWGGEVARIHPARTAGCWNCLQESFADGTIPTPPGDPAGMLQPAGCASPTFTGTSFDIQEVSLFAIRLAMSALTEGVADGYPKADWDVGILSLRTTKEELAAPRWDTFVLTKHPKCPCKNKVP
ncbi:MAG: ThiF family adenylyltransferase [Blastocatellia bacterium]|nr:ThiF family adenylyltransferase [Blastocatellia bacterium]